jgi:hypothetical protein
MIREHWRDPGFWRWVWANRAPTGAKVGLAVLAAAAFLVGGFLAADRLSQAKASDAALTFGTTIEQQVTVREHGKTIVKRVRVVRRVFLRPQTAFETRYDTLLVSTPVGVRIVRQRVVRLVPVIKGRVVTVNGKKQVITETRLVPTTTIRTQTQTSVVTNQQTVVNQETVTLVNNNTETVPVTVTETRSSTVVETQTSPPVTVTETSPPVTLTETVTVPVVTVTTP